MPYISASIFMQLMTVLVPKFQKMQKEGDSGRKKINQYTRYLTVGVTIVQASAYVSYLNRHPRRLLCQILQAYFWLSTVVVLTAGTLFVMWMGEKITDKGLGNGTITDHHDRYPCPSASIIFTGISSEINPYW